MRPADNICLGHAIRPAAPNQANERTAVSEALEIACGERRLTARDPQNATAVATAEAILGYPERPVYAYVGDLHPCLGKAGLIVSRAWSDRALKGLTCCDSGGLADGIGGFVGILASDRPGVLTNLSTPVHCANGEWERVFADEVEQHHPNAAHGYIEGQAPVLATADPRRACVEFVVAQGDTPDRRLWTWELHLDDGPDPDDIKALVVPEQSFQQVLHQRRNGRRLPTAVRVIRGRVGPGGVVSPFLMPETRQALLGA